MTSSSSNPTPQPLRSVAPRETRTALGLAVMALGVFFLTMIDTSAKWLMLAGVPVFQVVFVRYIVHFGLSLVVFLPRDGRVALRSNAPAKQFLRSFFLLLGTIFLLLALRYLPITVNTTIMFALPIMVTLLAIPILGEKVGMHRFIAVFVGFGGVLVVMQPWGAGFDPAMFFSIGAVLASGLYFVLTRLLAGVDSNATSQIWSSGLASVCLLPFALAHWVWPETAVDWMFLGLVGVFGATAHTLVTTAHRLADASILAPVIYIQLLFASVVGIFVFSTWPTFWTLIGALIIIGSGIYIWYRERQANQRKSKK